MNTFNMTCEAVEATLPDYMDETLEAWVRSSVEEHLGQCLRCAALVRDLRNIEREAAALPDLIPVRDLWPGIESRISAPVVAFVPPAVTATGLPTQAQPPAVVREAEPAGVVSEPEPIALVTDTQPVPVVSETVIPVDSRRQGRRYSPVWMGAAAAALVVLTAGTTYLLTSRAVRSAPANVVDSRASAPTQMATSDPGQQPPGTERESTNSDGSIGSASPVAVGTGPRRPAPAGRRTPPAGLASRSATEAVYDKEILMLQSIMRWRKSELDPATAAIIDRNLRIIDSAIAQSKAALRRDPASAMISNPLTHALDKKVELLRTAAMLPSSS